MTKILHCCYNMDTGCVELTYSDGSVLSIDCEAVENTYNVTTRQMADRDWLLYNAQDILISLFLYENSLNTMVGIEGINYFRDDHF